jgi:hypothetical protein
VSSRTALPVDKPGFGPRNVGEASGFRAGCPEQRSTPASGARSEFRRCTRGLSQGSYFGKTLRLSEPSGRWKPAISHCDLHSATRLSRLPTNRTSSLGAGPVRNRSLNSASTRSWPA